MALSRSAAPPWRRTRGRADPPSTRSRRARRRWRPWRRRARRRAGPAPASRARTRRRRRPLCSRAGQASGSRRLTRLRSALQVSNSPSRERSTIFSTVRPGSASSWKRRSFGPSCAKSARLASGSPPSPSNEASSPPPPCFSAACPPAPGEVERAQPLEGHGGRGDLAPHERPLVDLPEPLHQHRLGAQRRDRLAVPLDVARLELVGAALPVEEPVDRLGGLQRRHLPQLLLRDEVQLDQDVTEPPQGPLLRLERVVELLGVMISARTSRFPSRSRAWRPDDSARTTLPSAIAMWIRRRATRGGARRSSPAGR